MSLKNKNLLIISNGYPSRNGVATNHIFVKNQVDVLKNYFAKIYVICPRPYIPWGTQNIFNFRSYSYDNVFVYYPKYLFFPNKYLIGLFSMFSTFFLICFKKIKFNLIHAHFTYKSGFIGVFLKIIFNKKLYLTVHENKDWYFKEINSKTSIYSYVWKKCDYIIRVNDIDINYLKIYNSNVYFIPNGYDSKLFSKKNKLESRIKLKLPTNKKILLHVGNYLINHKNQINILKAIKLLKNKRSDFIFYLVGKGKDEGVLRSKIKEFNLSDCVVIVGAQPHYLISYWMASSDLFIFPSYFESFGVVTIEALSQGLPVVSTYNGGSETILKSDKLGFLYKDPDDFKELFKLIDLSLNKIWDTSYIYNYSKKYRYENIVRMLVKLYDP